MREILHAPFTLNPDMIIQFFCGKLGDCFLPTQSMQHMEFKHILCNLDIAAWRADWTNANCLEICQCAPAICEAFQNWEMPKVHGYFFSFRVFLNKALCDQEQMQMASICEGDI